MNETRIVNMMKQPKSLRGDLFGIHCKRTILAAQIKKMKSTTTTMCILRGKHTTKTTRIDLKQIKLSHSHIYSFLFSQYLDIVLGQSFHSIPINTNGTDSSQPQQTPYFFLITISFLTSKTGLKLQNLISLVRKL